MDDKDNVVDNLEKRASKFKLLTRDEEHDLIKRAQAGEKRAESILYDHNIRLVKSVARRFLNKGMDYEDLIQEASLGFLHTLKKFDISKPFKLSTYCHWWLRQYASRAVSNKAKAIRIPIHQQNQILKVQKYFHNFVEAKGRHPLPIEIADGTGIDIKTVEKLRGWIQDVVSLDESVGDGGDDGLTRLSMEVAPTDWEPDFHIEDNLDMQMAHELLDTLSESDKKLVMYHYGFLDGGDMKTELDTAQFSRMRPEDVKKRLRDILNKLRKTADYHKLNSKFLTNLVIQKFETPESKAYCRTILKDFLEMSEDHIEAVMKSKVPIIISKVITALEPDKYKKDKDGICKETAPGKVELDNAVFVRDLMQEVGIKVALCRL